jgi:hypothetical protein
MAQCVRGDVLLLDGRARVLGGGRVLGDEPFDGVAGEPPAGLGGEQRAAGGGAELGEPGPEHPDGLAGELGDPQPGLDGEQQ